MDRRHMRSAFARFLERRGWDDLALRDALGFQRVGDMRMFLERMGGFEAQIESSERVVAHDAGGNRFSYSTVME